MKISIIRNVFVVFLLANGLIVLSQDCSNYYKTSKEIQSFIDAGNLNMSIPQFYALNGFYKKAIELSEKDTYIQRDKVKFSYSRIGDRDLNKLIHHDAGKIIIDSCKNHWILVLNESHHHPAHRAFAHTLLDSLYINGYRKIFVEALNNNGNKNAPCANIDLANYGNSLIQDPNYSNFLKYALALGFVLYPYEDNFAKYSLKDSNGLKFLINDTVPNWTPVPIDNVALNCLKSEHRGEMRELFQAANIYQNWSKQSNDKIFIYCGYGHAMKEGNYMASFLKSMTEVEPLCIDQTYMNESSSKDYDYRMYKSLNFSRASIFFDSAGKTIQTLDFIENTQLKRPYDLIVFHPRSQIVNGRYAWEYLNNKRFPMPYMISVFEGIPKKTVKAYVYYLNDKFISAKGCIIPRDIVEIQDFSKPPVMLVEANKSGYLVVFRDEHFKFINQYSATQHDIYKYRKGEYFPNKILEF